VYTNEVQRLKCQQDSKSYVTTVTLDPRHSHRKTKEFVYGTNSGMLLLSSKGWLGNTETILFQGRGPVFTARMAGTLLAWATESGLRVYNTADHCRIGKIDRPVSLLKNKATSSTNGNSSASSTHCSLTWVGERELLAGWGNHVMVLEIVRSTISTNSTINNVLPSAIRNTSNTVPETSRPEIPSPTLSTAAGSTPPPPSSSFASREFALQVVSDFKIGQENETINVVGVAPFGRHLAVLISNTNNGSNSTSAAAFKVFDRSGNELFTDPIDRINNLEQNTTTSAAAAAPLLGFASCYSIEDVLKETTAPANPAPANTPVFLQPPTPPTTAAAPSIASSTDYKWWSDGAEPVYFFISPKSITLGRPPSATDRISWLVQRNRYDEAVRIAESDSSIKSDARIKLGEQYFHYLTETEEPQQAMKTGFSKSRFNATASGGNDRTSQQNESELSKEGHTNNALPTRDGIAQIKNQQVVSVKNYQKAADVCPRLLGKDSAAWERWVYIFGQAAQLPLLAPKLPTSDPVLSRAAYDMVLTACLRKSSTTRVSSSDEVVPAAHDVFRDLIERWPHGIYDAHALIKQLQSILDQQQRPSSASSKKKSLPASAALKRAAASLYAQLGQHNAALRLLLELKSPSIFEYIKTNALQALAANFAADLIELDEVKATQLMVEAAEEAPPAVVVASLQNKISKVNGQKEGNLSGTSTESSVWSLRLYHYVDWLWQREISPTGSGISATTTSTPNGSFSSSLSELHIKLCATHDPSRLMYILTTSSSYPLDAALHICQSHGNLIRESVYLLGRMGSTDAALRLIITQLRDVQGAVTFVQDSAIPDDSSLWELLISLTLGDAALTGALLDYAPTGGGGGISSCVDPLRLVESIPEDIKIERLRDRLIRVITDFKATVSLQSGCNAVLKADCLKLGDRLYSELRRALRTLYVLKPGGKWSTESNGGLGAVNALNGVVEVSASDGSGEGGVFPFENVFQPQEEEQKVWIGVTKSKSSSASRKMSLTPPPSVHTSPSKFPPSHRKRNNNTEPHQQRTLVL